jgi:nucleoside phosphorylase
MEAAVEKTAQDAEAEATRYQPLFEAFRAVREATPEEAGLAGPAFYQKWAELICDVGNKLVAAGQSAWLASRETTTNPAEQLAAHIYRLGAEGKKEKIVELLTETFNLQKAEADNQTRIRSRSAVNDWLRRRLAESLGHWLSQRPEISCDYGPDEIVEVHHPEEEMLRHWAAIDVVKSKFLPGWWDMPEFCRWWRIPVDANGNQWLAPIGHCMRELFGELLTEDALIGYLFREHTISPAQASSLPLEHLATLLREDCERRRKHGQGAHAQPVRGLESQTEEGSSGAAEPTDSPLGEPRTAHDPAQAPAVVELAGVFSPVVQIQAAHNPAHPPAVVKGSPAAHPVLNRQESQQGETPREADRIDVGIVIALEEEFRELHEQIKVRCQVIPDPDTGRSFYLFDSPSADPEKPYRCLSTFFGGMGPTKAALVTQHLVKEWNPGTVVMLGIAGGLDKELSLGDVVVASVVDNFLDRGKAIPTQDSNSFALALAGDPYRPNAELINKIQHFEFTSPDAYQRWRQACSDQLQTLLPSKKRNQLIRKKWLREAASIKDGHIASSPIVGAAEQFADWLKQRDRSYMALEMEAGGLMAALCDGVDPKRALIIRGISDFADERKAKLDKTREGGIRRYAMRNCISLLWALLETRTFLPRS